MDKEIDRQNSPEPESSVPSLRKKVLPRKLGRPLILAVFGAGALGGIPIISDYLSNNSSQNAAEVSQLSDDSLNSTLEGFKKMLEGQVAYAEGSLLSPTPTPPITHRTDGRVKRDCVECHYGPPDYELRPTHTPTESPTSVVTFTATATPYEQITSSPTTTATPQENTPTATPYEQKTKTPTPTQEETPTNTPTQTNTATPEASSTSTATVTSTVTNTATRTATPQVTTSATPSPEASATFTQTATNTATATPTVTASSTPEGDDEDETPVSTNTPTVTASSTSSPTSTATYTPQPDEGDGGDDDEEAQPATATPTNTATSTPEVESEAPTVFISPFPAVLPPSKELPAQPTILPKAGEPSPVPVIAALGLLGLAVGFGLRRFNK